MSTIRERAAAWLGRQVQTAGGWDVRYTDGNKTCAITATPIKREYEVFTDGMPTRVVRYDFIVTASELISEANAHQAAGERISPRLGGLISITRNDVIEKYEVLPPEPKMAAVEPMDANGTLLMLHTVKTDAKAA